MKTDYPLLTCILCCMIAAAILLWARIIPQAAPFSLIFLALAVFACIRSEREAVCLAVIAATVTLTLSLRFPYLPWADPWQDYEGVLEVLTQGSIGVAGYRLQQPVLPVIVAALSGWTGIAPMTIQKLAIPLAGSLSVSALYGIGKEYLDRETALAASIIFLTGIPYLHWASQGVRETLGIPFFLVALFVAHRAVKMNRICDLIITCILVSGLIMAHHLSAFMFCVIFPAMTLAELYLFRPADRMRREALLICVITGYALTCMLLWWSGRLSFIYISFIRAVGRFIPVPQDAVWVPVLIAVLILGLLASLPIISPAVTNILRTLMALLCRQQQLLRVAGFILGCGAVILLFTSLTGHSFLAIRYPAPMILAGGITLLLVLAGLPRFLSAERFPLLAFAMVPALMLILGMTRAVPGIDLLWSSQIDPLRFLGFLWPPLALIAGAGLSGSFGNRALLQPALITVFIISLVTVFPSLVFAGTAFEPGNPWFDNRSLIISHPASEVQAIQWYGAVKPAGNLTSDRYAFSAARWLNTQGTRVFEPVRRPPGGSAGDSWLITSRMERYANFIEWITQEARPVTRQERRRMDIQDIRMYDNGDAVVYHLPG